MGRNAVIVALLLDRGADFRLADATGATPLHYAAQSGNRDAALLMAQIRMRAILMPIRHYGGL